MAITTPVPVAAVTDSDLNTTIASPSFSVNVGDLVVACVSDDGGNAFGTLVSATIGGGAATLIPAAGVDSVFGGIQGFWRVVTAGGSITANATISGVGGKVLRIVTRVYRSNSGGTLSLGGVQSAFSTGSNAAASLVVSSATGQLVGSFMLNSGGAGTTAGVPGDQTLVDQATYTNGRTFCLTLSEEPGATSVTMSYTPNNFDGVAHLAYAIIETGGGGTTHSIALADGFGFSESQTWEDESDLENDSFGFAEAYTFSVIPASAPLDVPLADGFGFSESYTFTRIQPTPPAGALSARRGKGAVLRRRRR